ncbi:hypothetical protein DL96DRAFT_1615477 [Flagelloscypha sp. PMI_526]|nr:hypothetical protein DL96DRAFT_1615477 [Flagelloscypha sp. PMI_526]
MSTLKKFLKNDVIIRLKGDYKDAMEDYLDSPSTDANELKNLREKYEAQYQLLMNALKPLPAVVLHIIEDKKPGVLAPDAFDPNYQDLKGRKYSNIRAIVPQLKRYCFEFNCPYISLCDYFSFYEMKIPLGAIESTIIDGDLRRKKAGTKLDNIQIMADASEPPRKLLFSAVLERLEDMGIVRVKHAKDGTMTYKLINL